MNNVKVTIKFKNTELKLSVDEARELHGILDKLLFGVKAPSEVDKFSIDDLKQMLKKEMPKIVPISQPYPIHHPVLPSHPSNLYWEITWLGNDIGVRNKCVPVDLKTDQVAE